MDTQTVALISIICTVLGAVIGVLTYNRNRDKDVKNNAKNEAEMKVTLAHISKGVDDIKVDMRATKEQMHSFARDLVRVEESVKSAHKRLNKLEGKVHED